MTHQYCHSRSDGFCLNPFVHGGPIDDVVCNKCPLFNLTIAQSAATLGVPPSQPLPLVRTKRQAAEAAIPALSASHQAGAAINGRSTAARFLRALLRFARAWRKGQSRYLTGPAYAERLTVCQTCAMRSGNKCTWCGCFLKGPLGKARLSTEQCPLQKWPGDDPIKPCGCGQ